jgi:hypothetical protein
MNKCLDGMKTIMFEVFFLENHITTTTTTNNNKQQQQQQRTPPHSEIFEMRNTPKTGGSHTITIMRMIIYVVLCCPHKFFLVSATSN